MKTPTRNTPTSDVRRIRPIPDPITQPFWDAANTGVLAIQRCDSCGRFQHPPQSLCLSCGSVGLTQAPVSGNARLYSWTTTYHRVIPGLEAALPYICLIVELVEQEGLWMLSDLIDRPDVADFFRIGLPMKVVFDAHPDDVTLAQFVPSDDADTTR